MKLEVRDEVVRECRQAIADCTQETAKLMAYLETIKAKSKPTLLSELTEPTIGPPRLRELVVYANATIERSKVAVNRSRMLDITAGVCLVEIKKLFQEVPVVQRAADVRSWEDFCIKHLVVKKHRADELIRILTGRLTQEESRRVKRLSVQLSRERDRKRKKKRVLRSTHNGATQHQPSQVKEINAFHKEATDFLIEFKERVETWYETAQPLDPDGKAALMQAFYLCSDGFARLAQHIDGR